MWSTWFAQTMIEDEIQDYDDVYTASNQGLWRYRYFIDNTGLFNNCLLNCFFNVIVNRD